jgi:hypothetical protein
MLIFHRNPASELKAAATVMAGGASEGKGFPGYRHRDQREGAGPRRRLHRLSQPSSLAQRIGVM